MAAALAAGAVYVQARWPGFAPGADAYARSGRWHFWAWLGLAVVASWLAWRLRPTRRARRAARVPESTALYRWYDIEARLLYVGISNQPVRRTGQHDDHQPWWREVRSATVEWLPTRGAAFAAEEDAIKREKPLHNIVHNGPRAAYRKAS